MNSSHLARLVTEVAAIRGADRIDAFRLSRIEQQLRRYHQRALRFELDRDPEGAAEYFGKNWHGPAIDDLIADARRIAAAPIEEAA